MAIQVNYIDGGIGIEVLASGTVSGAEIIEYREKLYESGVLDKQRYQLIDRSQCRKYFVSNGDIKRIAEIDAEMARENPDVFIAIVSPNEMMRSAAEIWASYLEYKVGLFSERNIAIAWLESCLGEKIPLS